MDVTAALRVPARYVLGFALAIAVGLLLSRYLYPQHVASGRTASPLGPLIEELGAAWAAAAVVPAIIGLARRFPLDRRGWVRRIPAHVAGALAFAAYHTSAMWATRSALYPLAGLGNYDYGRMPVRYLMELPQQVIIFAIVVALTHLYDRHRAAQRRELRISQLETELVRARLDTLRMQLNPHFLFNTLNTVSSVMYDSLDAADEVLTRLGELLRRSIREEEGHEVSLRDELETLDLYLGIMRARFGDRLDVRTDIAAPALDALVPAMFLQPLVENAIEHGTDADGGILMIAVTASVANDALRIEVLDSGRGTGDRELRRGIGLGNTVERLGKLYGAAHRIDAGSMSGGGFSVRLEIPFRVAAGELPGPAERVVEPV
jgi:two-component system, LytTR family, sensor kinase